MSPSQVEFLHHILDECNYLLQEYHANTFSELTNNRRLSHAVCRGLEIIGEAAKNVDPEIKAKYPEVEWKKMSGIRDVIIHDYFGIDYEIIWQTLETKIAPLKEWIEIIIAKEKSAE